MKRKSLIFLFLMTVVFSLKGNEVKVVQAFKQIDGTSVSLARSEWKNYLNLDAKVPMEYSIFKVRIKGNADAVKKAKGSFKLDLGSQLMVKDTYTGEDNEIWFLVPRKAKLIYLQCGDGCEKCQIWSEQIIPDKVYYGEVEYTVEMEGEYVSRQKRTSQVFVLTFTPKSAMVEIDGRMVETDDGTYSEVLTFGRHEFRVSAKNYHPEAGVVEIGEEKKVMDVELRPAFGWIEIKGPGGAAVYIDGERVGAAPMKSDPLASGSHDVRVTKEKYLPYREQVAVNDNATTTITPVLTANFVTVRLAVAGDAEIWVNDEKKGSGSVSLDLVPGEYSFETKKPSHHTQTIVRQITMSSGGTIDLPAPVAIVGSIMVDVKPVGAKVTVDGKPSGESPVILDNMLIGTHDVVISKAGCAERREQVTVTEGQTTTIEGRLEEKQKEHNVQTVAIGNSNTGEQKTDKTSVSKQVKRRKKKVNSHEQEKPRPRPKPIMVKMPTHPLFFNCVTLDDETEQVIPGMVTLMRVGSQDTAFIAKLDPSVGYVCNQMVSEMFIMNVKCRGYIDYNDTIYQIDNDTVYARLTPLKKNGVIILRNILFETNKAVIKNASVESLDGLYRLLAENPAIRIQITGHTDNVGDKRHNLKLSEERAKAVCQEMIKRGIDPKRISWRGAGDSEPIESNDTPEGRAENRRVDFMIL